MATDAERLTLESVTPAERRAIKCLIQELLAIGWLQPEQDFSVVRLPDGRLALALPVAKEG